MSAFRARNLNPSVNGGCSAVPTPLPTNRLFTGAMKRLAEALAPIHLNAAVPDLPDAAG